MTPSIISLLPRFKDCRLLVVGDLMIDEYLWGEVDRISPEAPVQVVEVQSEEFVLGGAGNVASNLSALGAKVSIAGVIGTADDGRRLLDLFKAHGIDARAVIPEPGRRTTRKTRVIASNQHVIRIDRETRRHISEATLDKLGRAAEEKMTEVDALLISDYDKGLMTPSLLRRLIDAGRAAGKPVIVDPKGIDFEKYTGASLITPNRKEASLASGVVILDEDTLVEAARQLMAMTASERLLITCGKDGMVLFHRNGTRHRVATRARQVYDVSGAGDTVISVMGLAMTAGATWEEATEMANAAAGVVIGKVGTATLTVGELESALITSTGSAFKKEHKPDTLEVLCREVRRTGRRIVFTNGCFDILHAGHIQLFSAARAEGDFLIVAIDDDDSVRKLKGPDRPVINERARVRILSALDSVDAVVVFSTDQLEHLIGRIRPDVLAKGNNYLPEEVVGRNIVEKTGGRLALLPIDRECSSDRIIESIRNGGRRPSSP
jgi:D-beta-D-heptose 7-phosphate kinase/D-beta-D-heptose 1-phosphate adenosyltransferase